jgi:uncharacterized protein with von Willebrand factor type A (vWA) domain
VSERFRAYRSFRYARWDGTQAGEEPDGRSVLDALADDYLRHGDLGRALRRLAQHGYTDAAGGRRLGLKDLLERLKHKRQERLERFDLGSVLEDIRRRLERVKTLERQALDAAGQGPGTRTRRQALDAAGQGPGTRTRRQALDGLPADPAEQIRQLSRYDFASAEARREFEALLDELRRHVVGQQFRGLKDALGQVTPADLARLRQMLAELNRMLRDRAEGHEPDFDGFMARYGEAFPGAESLDQLVHQLQRRRQAMQGLLESLSPQQRLALQAVVEELTADPGLRAGLQELAATLEGLAPGEARTRFAFSGDEAVGLGEALELMSELQALDALERAVGEARRTGELDRLDPGDVARLLGEEEAGAVRELQALARQLEDARLVRRDGGRLELTARGIRRIGQKALEDIFARLERDVFGQHRLPERGHGGDRADDTKPYAFGDAFHLHIGRTLMRAVTRQGPGTPVRLGPGDFEVHETEQLTRSATVVMLDMSLSMLNRDLWLPAKKVAIALQSLIRIQFPRDQLHVVGFAHVAQVYRPEELLGLTEWDALRGTNMVHGLRLARELLARSRAANKQVIMVTDGGPTVWQSGGHWAFEWPTNVPTELQTLREVRRCARERIAINVFMLAEDPDLRRFVGRMATLNRGRAFYADPDDLGRYVLIDYLRNKRRQLRGGHESGRERRRWEHRWRGL